MPNRVEAGKLPRSSMPPSFVFAANGDVEEVVGLARRQQHHQYMVKTLVGPIDWKLEIQAAIDLLEERHVDVRGRRLARCSR